MPVTDALYQLTFLCLLVVLSEWMVRRTFMRHFGTALLVILLTAIVANLGLLPAGSSEEQPVPVYEEYYAVERFFNDAAQKKSLHLKVFSI